MRGIRRLSVSSCHRIWPVAMILLALFCVTPSPTVRAATINVGAGDVTGLITAIIVGNTTPTTINLTPSTYTFTDANRIQGANALPAITGTITISGGGATLARDTSQSNFRFFTIDPTGTLQLSFLTLTHGAVSGTPGNPGTDGTNGPDAPSGINNGQPGTDGTQGGDGGSATGGAILNNGTLTVVNGTFTGNSVAAGNGGQGGIGGNGGQANFGQIGGMGPFISGTGGKGGKGADGGAGGPASGGAISTNGSLTISNSTFSNNNATGGAGGNAGSGGNGGPAAGGINGGGGDGSDAGAGGGGGSGSGGAIVNSGSLMITGSTFAGNVASGGLGRFGGTGGSGNYAGASPSTSGNGAAGGAGGAGGMGTGGVIASTGGSVVAINSTFSANSASGGVAQAHACGPGPMVGGGCGGEGGQAAQGSANCCGGAGGNGGNGAPGGNATGGTLIVSGGTASLINTTLSTDAATAGASSKGGWGGSGGAENPGGVGPAGTNGTDGLPAVGAGGGIARLVGAVTLANTIVTASPAGGNCTGTITDGGSNLEFNPTNTCNFSSNAQIGDPKLAALGSNGGPTQTMALGGGSLATGHGATAICTAAIPSGAGGVDQRGNLRQTVRCSIGAFEAEPQLPNALPGAKQTGAGAGSPGALPGPRIPGNTAPNAPNPLPPGRP